MTDSHSEHSIAKPPMFSPGRPLADPAALRRHWDRLVTTSLKHGPSAHARSPPDFPIAADMHCVPNGRHIALGSCRQKTARPVMPHRPC
jgi:hypothetical protein